MYKTLHLLFLNPLLIILTIRLYIAIRLTNHLFVIADTDLRLTIKILILYF